MTPEQLFHRLAKEIPDVSLSKMFGAQCLKVPNGKAAVIFHKDCLVLKLQGDAYDDAMSLDGTKLFDPMGGRPMKEWVQIPFEYKNKWKSLAICSVNAVKLLEKKTPKKK